jgi:hypothetical protein
MVLSIPINNEDGMVLSIPTNKDNGMGMILCTSVISAKAGSHLLRFPFMQGRERDPRLCGDDVTNMGYGA